ncbi:MAG: Competence protein, partial [Firmicutes bacterium]|nr:Competence protein [Bacillota bacterium]
REYTLPWLPKRDRKSAMSLLVDEEISIARSDLLYDFRVISEEKHKCLQVLLGATRRSILEQYTSIFGEAGFKIAGVDFAFPILGEALGFESNEDVLYLHKDSESLQLVLFRGTAPEGSRTLSSLLSKAGSEESIKVQGEVWENEISRFLLYHRTQHPDLNLKRLVWNGDFTVDKLVQKVSASNQSLTINRAALKGIPDSWRRVVDDNPGRSEVVVGYASRNAKHRSGLNLWYQPTSERKVHQIYLGVAVFTGALLFVGTIIWFSLFQMALPLQQEVNQLSLQGTRIEEQNRSQEALVMAWNKASTKSEEIGRRLAQVHALAGTGLEIEQVVFKQGGLSVRGSANESKSVQAMIQDLRDLGWEEPVLSSYKMTALSNVEFTLSAKYGRINSQEADTNQ